MLWLRDHPVSIHALLAECDTTSETINQTTESFNPRTPCGVRRFRRKAQVTRFRFQSTHSLRSATHGTFCPRWRTLVSIHALLAECDLNFFTLFSCNKSFNPRTPCGVRPRIDAWPGQKGMFQSTHSLRSATARHPTRQQVSSVSIHALLAECDPQAVFRRQGGFGFNPRTPCGVRPQRFQPGFYFILFQSTHSLRSATPCL